MLYCSNRWRLGVMSSSIPTCRCCAAARSFPTGQPDLGRRVECTYAQAPLPNRSSIWPVFGCAQAAAQSVEASPATPARGGGGIAAHLQSVGALVVSKQSIDFDRATDSGNRIRKRRSRMLHAIGVYMLHKIQAVETDRLCVQRSFEVDVHQTLVELLQQPCTCCR